ncbi:SIR2 family protein [Alicyclobacillus sp. SO9]|uniref:SIR2 family protein n=1 Tax=Alicyclobacillus sp. SO9 TaxID=2665646 RepID=UPI0018E75D83|nr:SIR2 family protein [Alicyclobacillus sp. SO9]QQE77280.1 SIR2 family protein [Alicyclobacillus sp. SO9]
MDPIDYYEQRILELLSHTRLSFLIGAGCSRCAGLPLMGQLTDEVYSTLTDKEENNQNNLPLKLLTEIKRRYESAHNATIEDYLSELQDIDAILERQEARGVTDTVYPPGYGPYTRQHTQQALRLIKTKVRDVLSKEISSIRHHRTFCRAIQYQLRDGRNAHPVNYFILNYDTLIEDALALEGIAFSDGFVGGATAWWDPTPLNGEEFDLVGRRGLEARVLKLHGSIDWVKTQEHDFPMRLRNTLPHDEIIGSGESVVIYPASAKYREAQYDPFSRMMISFRHSLSSQMDQVLAILGYSFGDAHINADIIDAIKRSQGGLSLAVFLGLDELPPPLRSWINDPLLQPKVIIFGKKRVWENGSVVFESESELEWYKFEVLATMLSKETN